MEMEAQNDDAFHCIVGHLMSIANIRADGQQLNRDKRRRENAYFDIPLPGKLERVRAVY